MGKLPCFLLNFGYRCIESNHDGGFSAAPQCLGVGSEIRCTSARRIWRKAIIRSLVVVRRPPPTAAACFLSTPGTGSIGFVRFDFFMVYCFAIILRP